MEKDAELAISILLVPKGVLDLGLAVVIRCSEVVVPHGNGNISTDIDLVVVKNDV